MKLAGASRFNLWSFFFSLRGRTSRRAFCLFELSATVLIRLAGKPGIPLMLGAFADNTHTDVAIAVLIASLCKLALGLSSPFWSSGCTMLGCHGFVPQHSFCRWS